MTKLKDIDNKTDSSKRQRIFLSYTNLKELVQKMQDSLRADRSFNSKTDNTFSHPNDEIPTINYESEMSGNLSNTKSLFKKNSIRHKLIRIHTEFKFEKRNLKKYQLLTKREKQIIQLLANGNSNLEIAQQLYISRCTVEQHRKNINRKLKIKSFHDLIRYSYAFNLI